MLIFYLPFLIASLQASLDKIAATGDGRVGICIQAGAGEPRASVNGDQRFPMQSVMKLPVAMAVLDAVDHRGWKLDEKVTLYKRDLSLFVQPIAKLVADKGYTTTIDDLMRRAIVDSDSAATDFLIAKLGGPQEVQAFLNRNGIQGVRVDRNEKDLQTEIVGLKWKPEYLDPPVLDRAIAAVPKDRQEAAFRRYQRDPRDTATPKGMAQLLASLAAGKLLSASSTARLMTMLEQTVTFPDRLKAGLAPGWSLGHKTGTSGSWNGITAATNDVGILKAPDGTLIAVAVFIADSKEPSEIRARRFARVSAAIIENH